MNDLTQIVKEVMCEYGIPEEHHDYFYSLFSDYSNKVPPPIKTVVITESAYRCFREVGLPGFLQMLAGEYDDNTDASDPAQGKILNLRLMWERWLFRFKLDNFMTRIRPLCEIRNHINHENIVDLLYPLFDKNAIWQFAHSISKDYSDAVEYQIATPKVECAKGCPTQIVNSHPIRNVLKHLWGTDTSKEDTLLREYLFRMEQQCPFLHIESLRSLREELLEKDETPEDEITPLFMRDEHAAWDRIISLGDYACDFPFTYRKDAQMEQDTDEQMELYIDTCAGRVDAGGNLLYLLGEDTVVGHVGSAFVSPLRLGAKYGIRRVKCLVHLNQAGLKVVRCGNFFLLRNINVSSFLTFAVLDFAGAGDEK